MHRPLRLAPLLAALTLALAPAAAHAAVSFTSAQLTPATTQAGAHDDVTIATGFAENPTSDDLKSITVVLPPGLVGNPNAADRCAEATFRADTCPVSSRVGSTQTSVQVAVLPGVEVPQTVSGDVYNLQPQGAEPARLGVVLRPSVVNGVSLPKVFLESGAVIGPQTGYGIQTTFDNLPRTSGGMDIRITGMTLALQNAAPHGDFLTNPTDCRPATATFTATSYDAPGTPATATSTFTPTGCDALPFAPTLTGTMGGAGQTAAHRSPTLTTDLDVPAGDANPVRVAVTLPLAASANLAAIALACPTASFAAGTCPATSRVGTALASSPVLTAPMTGPVLLVATSDLPELVVQLSGPVPVQLAGSIALPGTTTFDGIPDVPLSRFELTIDGGSASSLLINAEDLCKRGAHTTATANILAHSGRTAQLSAPLEVVGCVGTAASKTLRATGSLRVRRGRGSLVARVRSVTGAPALSHVRLTLPKGLRPAHRLRGLRVTGGSKRLSRKALRVHGRTLDVALRKGTRSVVVRWSRLRAARSVRRGRTSTFVARVRDARGHVTPLRLRVKSR